MGMQLEFHPGIVLIFEKLAYCSNRPWCGGEHRGAERRTTKTTPGGKQTAKSNT